MSVIVTGAAGFIGSHLTARLLEEGEHVIGVDCLTDNYDVALKRENLSAFAGHREFQFEDLDLATGDALSLVRGVSCIYHLAGQPGVRPSWGEDFAQYVRNNIIATQRLLECVRVTKSRLVFASSSSVYGDAQTYPTVEESIPQPSSPYGVTKLGAEQLVLAYHRSFGLDVRCVRYFTVYGPRQRPDMAFSRFISSALRGEPIEVYGDGQQKREFTFVSDAVDATLRAGTVEQPSALVFNVGGGTQATVSDVIALVGDILRVPVAVRHLPAQPGDVRETGADLSRSKESLGLAPHRAPVRWAISSGRRCCRGAWRPSLTVEVPDAGHH